MRGLLLAVSEEFGHPTAPEWEKALEAVPRHRFLPERIWLRNEDGILTARAIQDDPDGWFAAAYANDPVVTQVNDGKDPGDDPWPSSSASAPSIVVQMLEMLELRAGMTVLEVGTGTGWNSALLSHRLGEQNVASIEVDPEVTARARTALTAAGLTPEVVCGDGRRGWAVRAPFDRIEATCSVTRVPGAWVEQTKPGGVILTPWDNPWVCWGLLRLTVGENGSAEGMFSPYSAFMLMRGQRTDLRIYRDVVHDEHVPDESHTDLPAHEIAEEPWDAAFTIGMRLGNVWQAWDEDPDVEGVARRLWLATTDTKSWAAVDDCGPDTPGFTVWQHGERRLWDELAAAHAWWLAHGEPGPERFGVTVSASGDHTFWLDSPGSPLSDL